MTDRQEPTPSHEYFLELAKTLPKIPVDDPRVQEILATTDSDRNRALRDKYFGQFGNNFYMLFEALRLQREGKDLRETYFGSCIRRVETAGEPFQRFLSANAELLGEIETVERENKPADSLFGYWVDLMNARRWDDADALGAATGHPLGMSAITYLHNDRMNPLLVRASKSMEAVGVDPTRFYG